MIFKFFPTVSQVITGNRLALIDAVANLRDYEVGYGGWPTALLNWHAEMKKLHGDVVTKKILDEGLEPNMQAIISAIGASRPDPRIPADLLEIWVATGGKFLDDALTEFGHLAEEGQQLVIVASEAEQASDPDPVDPDGLTTDGFSYVQDAIQHRGSELVQREGQSSPGRTLMGPLFPRWDMLPIIKLSLKPSLIDFEAGQTDNACELLCRELLWIVPWSVYPSGLSKADVAKVGAFEVMKKLWGSNFDSNGRSTTDPYSAVDADPERSLYHRTGGQVHWADPEDRVAACMEQVSALVKANMRSVNWLDAEMSDTTILSAAIFYTDHRATTPTGEWTTPAWADGRLTDTWLLPWCTEDEGIVGYLDAVAILYSCYRHLALQAAAVSTEDTRIKQLVSSGAVDGDEDVQTKKPPATPPRKEGSILPWLLGGAAVLGTAAAVASRKNQNNNEGAAEPSKE